MKIRPTKDDYYLNIAETMTGRSTCLRRNYGAVILTALTDKSGEVPMTILRTNEL